LGARVHTCVEEQSVGLARFEAQRDRILRADDRLAARFGQVVGQELLAPERRFRRCLV